VIGVLSLRQRVVKRVFDLAAATMLLVVLLPVLVLAVLVAAVDTRSSGIFTQVRIGRQGRPFTVLKLRTMRSGAEPESSVSVATHPSISRVGRLLRRTKLDEVPQLINVLAGQMSIVGPRPDVPGFADALRGPERDVLAVKPGLTSEAVLKYLDEELLLDRCEDPERFNREVIFPDKLRLNLAYVRGYRFSRDIEVVLATVRAVLSLPGRRGRGGDAISPPSSGPPASPTSSAPSARTDQALADPPP
jgi:lipopolysaccharide/colanic/teichoic acid biosynthesis glycosyltransferase